MNLPKDYATAARKAFIRNTNEAKINQAKRRLGTRYVCHPCNHVKRLAEPFKGPANA